jgi:hypothetical protein
VERCHLQQRHLPHILQTSCGCNLRFLIVLQPECIGKSSDWLLAERPGFDPPKGRQVVYVTVSREGVGTSVKWITKVISLDVKRSEREVD